MSAYSYDGLGRMTSLVRGNGVVTSYRYDPVGRLSQLGHDISGTTHDVTWQFSYNPANQLMSSSRSNDVYAWTGHGNVDRDYGVNGLNQLTNAGTTGLGYDPKGNLTQSGSIGYNCPEPVEVFARRLGHALDLDFDRSTDGCSDQ